MFNLISELPKNWVTTSLGGPYWSGDWEKTCNATTGHIEREEIGKNTPSAATPPHDMIGVKTSVRNGRCTLALATAPQP
jgi:hypothetical protein